MNEPTRPDDSPLALEDAIRVERMALDNGSGVEKNLGALARELRRTQAQVAGLEDRL
jgi:hypothetical protein